MVLILGMVCECERLADVKSAIGRAWPCTMQGSFYLPTYVELSGVTIKEIRTTLELKIVEVMSQSSVPNT